MSNLAARSKVGCKYLDINPSDTVNNILPSHFKHIPDKGGLLYFSLQLTHLNCCVLNFLMFPLISLIKCLSITNLATSAPSTALIISASLICPKTLSCIVGIDLYAEHLIPALKS